MGYVLLWIENLAVSLLLVATLVACLAQLGPSRWFARGFALLVVCVGALAAVSPISNGFEMKPPVWLLWITVLVACAACAGWVLLRERWLGAAALWIALVPLVIGAGLALVAAWIHWQHVLSGALPAAIVMLTAAYSVGAAAVLVYGLRRQSEPTLTRAGTWPRGRLAAALLVVAALHLMTLWNLDLAARQQLATVQAEAGALALSVAPPRVSDRDNAMLLYQQAFEAMGHKEYSSEGLAWDKPWQDTWDKIWNNWQDLGKLDFDLHDPELGRFLQSQARTLALLRQAAAKPGCSFERDYGRPSIDMLIPELIPLRTGARLLALDALLRASGQDYRGSIDDINAMLRMAEHVGADPLLVSGMMAVSIEGLAMDTLECVLASGRVPTGDLAAIRISDNVSYRAMLKRAFRMEEALQLASFDQVGRGIYDLGEMAYLSGNASSRSSRNFSWFAPLYRVFLLGDDLAANVRFFGIVKKAASLPYYQSKELMERYDRELKGGPCGILTRLMLPGMHLPIETAARAEARRDAARLGVALCLYRARSDRLPAKLDDLVPGFIAAVPPDPFDGQAMRFKRSKQGAVVYSIGPDLIDNGGAPYDRKTKTGDIIFTVP